MSVSLREKKLKSGKVSYYLDINQNGNRWTEFLNLHINKKNPNDDDKEKKQLAIQIRARRENELFLQENNLVDKTRIKGDFVIWFEQFFQNKKTTAICHSVVYNIRNYQKDALLTFETLNPSWIKGFTTYLLRSGVSNNSVASYLRVFFTALEAAVIEEIIPVNPFRKIPRHERIRLKRIKRDYFSMEELSRLVSTPCNIHPQIKQSFLFSCFTGLRWSDVSSLLWSEVIIKNINDEVRYFIYFQQNKTGGLEYLPLSPQAVDIILDRKKEVIATVDNSPYVFPQIKEKHAKSMATYSKVSRGIKKWGMAAGFTKEQMHFHTGRHSFATNVLEHSPDGDLLTVSKLLGHKSIQTTQIYAHIRDSRKQAAVGSLPRLTIKPLDAA